MGGVAGYKTSAFGKLINAPRMDFIEREPFDVRNFQLQLSFAFNLRLNFFKEDFVVFVRAFRKGSYDAIAVIPLSEECGKHFASERNLHCIVRQFPIDARVGDIKQALESAAGECKSQVMSYLALRPITSNQVLRCNGLVRSPCGSHSRCDARIILRKTFQLGLPQNLFAVSSEVVV